MNIGNIKRIIVFNSFSDLVSSLIHTSTVHEQMVSVIIKEFSLEKIDTKWFWIGYHTVKWNHILCIWMEGGGCFKGI